MPDLMCCGLDAASDTFSDLSIRNPIIFRVHESGQQEAFIAKAFRQQDRSCIPTEKDISRAMVVDHILEWTPKDSPWMSCTFSLPYVLWEAHRRSKDSSKPLPALHISLVHAAHPSLQCRAILAVEALHGPVPRASMQKTRRAINFARAFQEVLIYGEIPQGAVLATVPWNDFSAHFESTHLQHLHANHGPLRFFGFCERLREVMSGKDTDVAMAGAVNQASNILGSPLYASVQDAKSLETATALVCDLSRTIFSWSYRHPSYRDESYKHETRTTPPVDQAFPTMKESLFRLVDKHPLHLRTILGLRLIVAQKQIAEYLPDKLANDVEHSSCRDIGTGSNSKPGSKLHLRSLKHVLLDTISAIDSLEKAISEEHAASELSQRQHAAPQHSGGLTT
ncbi:hypothetical protein BC835DRAFT_1414306 [Cytidiella melzeri]|nr:hypothetical protein BC835DRAFT_1414306 [Cytidiella melzeri]